MSEILTYERPACGPCNLGEHEDCCIREVSCLCYLHHEGRIPLADERVRVDIVEGQVQCVQAPGGVVVEIREYGFDSRDFDDEDIKTDEDGAEYIGAVW